MKFKEIATRLTGISCPVFGLSWSPPEADVTVAKRIITYLEDRRVLYQATELEIPAYCVDSVLEIRAMLTTELGKISVTPEFESNLRAMRAACRKFLDSVQVKDENIIRHGFSDRHYASWTFLPAIGDLRSVFGIHVAQIAVRHGLDVEDNLASTFPIPDK